MKKLSAFLFLILLILISVNSNAQIGDTVITRNNEKVYKFNGIKYYPQIFHDYDNSENNWVALSKGRYEVNFEIYKIDNDLYVQDSIKTSAKNLSIKYNNKIYGIHMRNYKYVDGMGYMDTITFYCYDINGTQLIKNIISTYNSDTLKYGNLSSNVLFTKERNFVILQKNFTYSSNGYSKLIVLDTLGNVLKTKIHKLEEDSDIEIVENDSNFEFFSNIYSDTIYTKIFVLDKNTLDVIDTIEGFDSKISKSNLYNINDSTYITVGNYDEGFDDMQMQIKIANRNKLNSKVIKLPLGISNSIDDDCFFPEFSKKLDYINLDSIYFVCYSSKDTIINNVINPMNSKYQILRIINFNINGNLNYDYAYDFDTNTWKFITGVKATTEGGLIIAVITLTESYFIKFMPNGFVGLSNVESGERASLRVYPNPAKDFVLVDIEADRFVEADIEIYDLGGRMVKKSKLSAKVGNRIDVSDLRAGVYGYRVVLNGKGVSGKIVIGE
ncbi:MAG: hypothetical protein H6Q15_2113 [Bacteroidetes bacterium]|nr:hypothetical protein [Bacteroidota bacterium]